MSFIPTIILIFAIVRLRRFIKRFDTSGFIANERLMSIHTIIYLFYSLSWFAMTGL